jgi:hypothetical protein
MRTASIVGRAPRMFRPAPKRSRFGARENRFTYREAQRDDDPA